MDPERLECPSCGVLHPASERFCEKCGMPLVHPDGGELDADERQQRARKIKPQFTEGPLVKVAHARDQPQADFIANLLLEEGIPCVLQNLIGGYSPMIRPCDVMVAESAAEAAREALAYQHPER
jgi:hypothetical protein